MRSGVLACLLSLLPALAWLKEPEAPPFDLHTRNGVNATGPCNPFMRTGRSALGGDKPARYARRRRHLPASPGQTVAARRGKSSLPRQRRPCFRVRSLTGRAPSTSAPTSARARRRPYAPAVSVPLARAPGTARTTPTSLCRPSYRAAGARPLLLRNGDVVDGNFSASIGRRPCRSKSRKSR